MARNRNLSVADRLVYHSHIVTIRGNSYRMRQHTDLWHALHTPATSRAHAWASAPHAPGGGDDLRLVPSPTCHIFNRRKCRILPGADSSLASLVRFVASNRQAAFWRHVRAVLGALL
jgi:hypothetical protein